MFIVSSLAENGDLFDFVAQSGGVKPEVARYLFNQIVEGVSYLHNRGIAHRDLKLDNCFLDSKNLVKIGDFGMQKTFAGPNAQKLITQVGSNYYAAPELRSGQEYDA